MPAVGLEDAQVVLVIEAQNQLAECIVDIPRNKSVRMCARRDSIGIY